MCHLICQQFKGLSHHSNSHTHIIHMNLKHHKFLGQKLHVSGNTTHSHTQTYESKCRMWLKLIIFIIHLLNHSLSQQSIAFNVFHVFPFRFRRHFYFAFKIKSNRLASFIHIWIAFCTPRATPFPSYPTTVHAHTQQICSILLHCMSGTTFIYVPIRLKRFRH